MGRYKRRTIDAELDYLLPHLPAILLDGPKGVGKTATAVLRSGSVRRLDEPETLAIVKADPYVVCADPTPTVIDEWQIYPPVFDAIRRCIDDDPTEGHFILTGSAAADPPTHSGAGRVTTLHMRPMSIPERLEISNGVSLGAMLSGSADPSGRSDLRLRDYVNEITASGFPAIHQIQNHRARIRQLHSYIDRVVDRDIAEAGHAVRRPDTLRAWLTAYAAATATTTSFEKIRDAATPGTNQPPAKTSTIQYVEALKRLRILDPLEPWRPTNNHLHRLTTAPKHYLADPALAAALVGIDATELVEGRSPETPIPRDGTFLGALFESLVALSVRTFAQANDAITRHLRTYGGRHEIDFIVLANNRVVGLEAKLSNTVTDEDVKHLLWLRDQIGDRCSDLAVINTGSEAYRRADGVAVIPLSLLTP